jgi:hypothetical protein
VAPLLYGCVLPVAPEFETEENKSPLMASVNPPSGSIVLDMQAVFNVEVKDPNSTDTLYARWLIDYPPFNDQLTPPPVSPVPHPGQRPGIENRYPLSFKPECSEHKISNALIRHRLMLVVSDRPFIDEDNDPPGSRRLDLTPSDAYAARAQWTFDKECP